MRLKKIKLAGFKSFVDPTIIPFPDDMTAIVGPNGCGKSNVIDAVRWVLGESSAKNLRGDAMTDVIFNGSSARKPVSQCSVELVFDNSGGRIEGEFASYQELSVKRVVNRDAQSQYYLNNSKCRRRDVTDLFLGTGLGPRSYAIIEQGMISRLIESKPQDLRVFIEEAAGISKYKERRRETETRIRHTKENLERLEDVRMELSQQLEKLLRQAQAARRYKALKASERELKQQQTLLRLRAEQQRLDGLNGELNKAVLELDDLKASQQKIQAQAELDKASLGEEKTRLAGIQKQLFELGTEISRLEQNKLHNQRRLNQIQQELDDIGRSEATSNTEFTQQEEQYQQLQRRLKELAPEQEETLLQLEQSAARLEQAQALFEDADQRARTQQQQCQQSEHQARVLEEQCHNREQTLERVQGRIQELQQELALDDGEQGGQLATLPEQLATLDAAVKVAEKAHAQARRHQDEQQRALNQAQEQRLAIKGQLQATGAELKGLETRHALAGNQALDAWQRQHNEPVLSLLEELQVIPGFERALDTLVAHFPDARVVEDYLPQRPISAQSLFYQAAFVSDKPPGSLAAGLYNEQVPALFTKIRVVEDISTLNSQRHQLAPNQSLLSKDGHWCGPDWHLGPATEEGDSAVVAQARIQTLRIECSELEQRLTACDADIARYQAAVGDARQRAIEAEAAQRLAERQRNQCQARLNALNEQRASAEARRSRLNATLKAQIQEAGELQEQLSQLAQQAELLEAQGGEGKDALQHSQQARDSARQALSRYQAEHQRLQQASHQQALKRQGLEHQLAACTQAHETHQKQLAELARRRSRLQSEQAELTTPLAEHQQSLDAQLERQRALTQAQGAQQDRVNGLENALRSTEQRLQALTGQMGLAQDNVQQLKLDVEGHRVRAIGLLEGLSQPEGEVEALFASLAPDLTEADCSRSLNKVQQSLARLGAVNLAAVEEYDEQAERKRHLDTQAEDLNQAMDTLASAIRKIDKETRQRFKDTFDRVNGDLQLLFPRVFGGGSAYLQLTDDDLLETGVTIMAQPPGKKNSTIHLLSGGEKALTALSLVFAIFRLNPAPFCLLDEVDAPLDDANVGRFCKLVSQMSENVQFIYITHNKIAMEMATHLTGVTMAEPGVSRMVAVDVDDAVALAQA